MTVVAVVSPLYPWVVTWWGETRIILRALLAPQSSTSLPHSGFLDLRNEGFALVTGETTAEANA